MSKIFLELLDKTRREVFRKLSFFKNYGYLAGGTALALQLQYRKSFDFDIFVKKEITNHLRLKVKQIFGEVDFYLNTSDQLSFTTKEKVGVTFVWYYYQPLYPPVKSPSLSLASISDIAADKAHTIGRRAVWRDYVDFFFLLKKRLFSLQKIIQLAEKKFGGEFKEALFLEQLVYFEDVRMTKIDFLKESYRSSEIKMFLQQEVEKYLQERKSQPVRIFNASLDKSLRI